MGFTDRRKCVSMAYFLIREAGSAVEPRWSSGAEGSEPHVTPVSRSQFQRRLCLYGNNHNLNNPDAFISAFNFQERGSAEKNKL